MRRSAWAVVLLGLVGGCMSGGGIEHGGGPTVNYGKRMPPPSVPGVAGPYGEKIPMVAPYRYAPPQNAYDAKRMMNASLPLDMVNMHRGGMSGFAAPGGMMPGMPGMPPTMMPPGGMLSPPGVPFMPGAPGGINPANFSSGGPGGVINAHIAPGAMPPGGVVPAQAAGPAFDPASAMRFPTTRTQVLFTKPTGMKVYWFTRGPDGKDAYSTTPIETPGRYNFAPGVYRLKLSNIPGRAAAPLYPTLEVVPCNAKTEAFLAHSAVPVNFTEYDFRQVAEGNYLVKVIYLPDPQFQDIAGAGIGEIINNPLEPHMDPVQEALRRGSILLIIRMGNVDQEAPETPPLSTPAPAGALPPGILPPGMAPPGFPPGMPPGMMPPGFDPRMAPPGVGPGPMPPGMSPDPRMGPLFQVPAYGPPPGFPPPGMSGRPMPGVTPLPPGIGGPHGVPPSGLIPPPTFGPGSVATPPGTPGAPFTAPSSPLTDKGGDKGADKTADKGTPFTPPALGSVPPKGLTAPAIETDPLTPPTLAPKTTTLPATPITAPPIPKVDAEVPVPVIPVGPGIPKPTPPEVPPLVAPPAVPGIAPPPSLLPSGAVTPRSGDPAVPGVPPITPTAADLAGKR